MIDNKAPYFNAKAFHENKFVNVSIFDYQGKWLVLFFYPRDFDSTCINELKDLITNYETIKKMGAEVISISNDTEFTHRAWHESSELLKSIKFPMVADPSGKISKAYNTYISEQGVSSRATFIIDPDGIVRAYERNTELLSRNVNELIRKINALKFSRKVGQEFCPVEFIPENVPEKKINLEIVKNNRRRK